MGLQSKPFNIKQLVDLNYQSQDNQHTIIINPQAQVEVQMIRQLAERLQEMSNLMRELVETMQRVNQQFNRSIGEMNRINRQTQNYMTQYLGIQNQILEISAQSEQSIDEQDQLQIQQKQNKNKQKKDGKLLYLCKLGLKISVPIAAFYLYRSLPSGVIQNTFTTAKKAFMSMFSSPIKYF